jgi:glutamate formiminotransferase / 5-formyltetrahydrofolate cyclo-ligase
VFECVLNVSEGRDKRLLAEFARASGGSLRDLHHDSDHHRSVLTLINDAAPLRTDVRSLCSAVVARLDLRDHAGVHPRLGVLDVVPFVSLDQRRAPEAVALRDEMARWLAETLGVPAFLYGPITGGAPRTLPEVRRRAFVDLWPDFGPRTASARTGATCVGARPVLVAWNLWLQDVSLADARTIASHLRGPGVRTLAFDLGSFTQVSCNLVDVATARPSALYGAVFGELPAGGSIARCELVGLAPRSVLDAEDPARWDQLGLSIGATIEARIGA